MKVCGSKNSVQYEFSIVQQKQRNEPPKTSQQ